MSSFAALRQSSLAFGKDIPVLGQPSTQKSGYDSCSQKDEQCDRFLLTAEWSTISARKNNAPNLQQWHGLYKEPEWITFAARADIPEERIATDTATLTDIATHILQTLKLEN